MNSKKKEYQKLIAHKKSLELGKKEYEREIKEVESEINHLSDSRCVPEIMEENLSSALCYRLSFLKSLR